MGQETFTEQFADHRRHAAGAGIILPKVFPGWLQVHQQRHLMPQFLPVVSVQRHAKVPRDGVQVNGSIGGTTNGRVHDDRVLEGPAIHDIRGAPVGMHHLDDLLARLIADLPAFPIRSRDRGGTRKLHAQRLGQGVHGRSGAHGVAIASGRCR